MEVRCAALGAMQQVDVSQRGLLMISAGFGAARGACEGGV